MPVVYISLPSNTPSPKRAKSYFTGSCGSSRRRYAVTSSTARRSFLGWSSMPRRRLMLAACTSSGSISAEVGMQRHKPKSTPRSSLRTIQRRNIFMRLAAEPLSTLGRCFSTLVGWGRAKNSSLKYFIAENTLLSRAKPLAKTSSSPPHSR